jgi:hypothetical protein
MSLENGQARTSPTGRIWAAVGVLAALSAIAIVVLVTRSGDEKSTQSTGNVSTAKSSTCGLADGSQSVPTTAPTAKWRLVNKFAAPSSSTFGPDTTSHGAHVCFAHNPTGALFAAANYLADSSNPDLSKAILVEQRIYVNDDSKLAEDGDDDAAPTNLQVSGFRVEDATTDRVSVNVVVRSTEGPNAGQNYALTLTLGWQAGDWRVIVPDNGQPPTSAISSLAGFTPWSGA